jgi:hypothetical protein
MLIFQPSIVICTHPYCPFSLLSGSTLPPPLLPCVKKKYTLCMYVCKEHIYIFKPGVQRFFVSSKISENIPVEDLVLLRPTPLPICRQVLVFCSRIFWITQKARLFIKGTCCYLLNIKLNPIKVTEDSFESVKEHTDDKTPD